MDELVVGETSILHKLFKVIIHESQCKENASLVHGLYLMNALVQQGYHHAGAAWSESVKCCDYNFIVEMTFNSNDHFIVEIVVS